MGKTFGYARVSTRSQKLQRQIDNILSEAPEAIIFEEKYTGTTTDRPQWKKLLKLVREGDTIIFDEVSRMSRNAEEGFRQYVELFEKGVKLVFIKEPHINTSVYKKAIETELEATGNEIADCYIEATNKVLKILQRQQIEIAFAHSQKERDFISQRVKEGIAESQKRYAEEEAKGIPHTKEKQGRPAGKVYETKKAIKAKEVIKTHSKDFGGSLGDADCMKLAGLARNTFYKYKREIKEES